MNYPKRQALVIGINEYRHLKYLESAVNDAEAIATILETQGNFQVKRMPSYKDENNRARVHPSPDSKKEITLRRLTDEIKHFFNPPGEQIPEVALLFFAGHGLWYEEFGKYHNFLATVNSDPEQEIWGYHLDKLQESLKHSPIREKIVWLDACHSGALTRDFESQKETKWCLISAAPDHDTAGENQQQGVLTAALLKALDYQQNNSSFIDSHALVKHLEAIRKADGITQQFTYKNSEQPILLTGQHLTVKDDRLQGVCPYKGLLYFDYQGHDPLFYKGRTALTAQLLDQVKKQRFVAVLGASGSGKSSLVRAGLIHQLQTGHHISGYWQILPIIRPGARPLAQLTTVLAQRDQKHSEQLLIIDQFEEAFTLCQDEQQREAFFEQLLTLTDLYLVIVMRADFFAHCIAKPYAGLGDKIKNHLFTITPMTVEELKQAIEEPAEKVGFRVQDLLTLEIIKDIEGSPSHLPLLQYTLEKVFWAQDANQQLTLTAYQQLGGIKGALASKADELYQSFSESEQETVKWLFLELTQLGEGQEDTRKQLTLPELEKNLGHRDGLVAVIDKLTTERLLIQDKNSSHVTIIDVAHEALIREWARLRAWIDENRDFRRWLQSLRGRLAGTLLLGVDLDTAKKYLATHKQQLNLEEQGYIEKSLRVKKINRVGLVLFLVVLGGIFGWQWWEAKEQQKLAENESQRVKQERDNAQLKAMSNTAEAMFDAHLEIESLIEIIKIGQKLKKETLLGKIEPETRIIIATTLQKILYQIKQYNRLEGHHGEITRLSFSQEGEYIVTSAVEGWNSAWKLWKEDGSLVRTIFSKYIMGGKSVSFSKDGKTIALSGNYYIELQTLDGQVIGVLNDGNPLIYDVEFSPDGKFLASTGGDIKIWRLSDNKLIKTLDNFATDISFSQNGQLFSAAGDDFIQIWTVEDGTFKTLKRIVENERNENDEYWSAIDISPNNQKIVSYNYGASIRLWDNKGNLLKTFPKIDCNPHTLDFNADGQKIAVACSNNALVKIFNLEGEIIETLVGHRGTLRNAIFSPDGKLLATAGFDATIILWNLNGLQLREFEKNIYKISEISQEITSDDEEIDIDNVIVQKKQKTFMSPTNQLKAVVEYPGIIKLFQDDKLISIFKGHFGYREKSFFNAFFTDAGIDSVSFSPDERIIASSSRGDTKLWKVDGTLIASIQGDDAHFLPDGNGLVIIIDGKEVIWSLDIDELTKNGCEWLNDYLAIRPQELNLLKVCQNPSNLIRAARKLAKEGDIDGAKKFFFTAIELEPELDIKPNDELQELAIPVLVEQIDSLQTENKIEKAVSKFQKIAELLNAKHTFNSKEDVYMNVAHLYKKIGDIEKAKEMYAASANNYNNIGSSLYSDQKYIQAMNAFEKSLNIFKSLKNKEGVSVALGNMGIVFKQLGNFQEAENMYLKSTEVLGKSADKRLLAINYNKLGNLYFEDEKLQQAENVYLQSAKIYETLAHKDDSDKENLADIYWKLGVMYFSIGNVQETISFSRKSLKITENRHIPMETNVGNKYFSLGIVCYDVGDFSQAEQLFSKSLEIYKTWEDRKNMAKAYNKLGMTYMALNQPEKGKNAYQSSIELFEKLEEEEKDELCKQCMAQTYHNFGTFYTKNNNLVLAEKMYLRSIKINQEILNKAGIAETYANLGSMYSNDGNLQLAETMLEKSIELWKEIGNYDRSTHVQEFLNELGKIENLEVCDDLGNPSSTFTQQK